MRVEVLGHRARREQTLDAPAAAVDERSRAAFWVVSVPQIEPLPWSTSWTVATTGPHWAVTGVFPMVAGAAERASRSGHRQRAGPVGVGDDHEVERSVASIGEGGGGFRCRLRPGCR